ncbi:MAG: hypothetical protein IPO27_09065 [Bacteroidetes bacterium]|nr:hypothetical protein [Bacteroidota bacterium]
MTYAIDTRNCYLQHFIAAPAVEIYYMLLSQNGLSQITGLDIEIDSHHHGKWICEYEGIYGYNLHATPNSTITLAVHKKSFPAYHFSIVTILLEEKQNGCFVFINQYGVPTDFQADFQHFWEQKILSPLSIYFDGLNLSAAQLEE